MSKELLAKLPSVDKVLREVSIIKLSENYGVDLVKKETQLTINRVREELLTNKTTSLPSMPDVMLEIISGVKKRMEPSLRSVINGTGVVLHTNLGRSSLSPVIQEHLNHIAFGYSNLEYDIEHAERGSRYQHLEKDLLELTGAEAALVVNNNAAAVMLALHTFAKDKEILVSRGELVEIGGSFRIPEIIELSGGRIKEVGTTNKTHLRDYEAGISEDTGVLLKVHTSNYKIIGFSESVDMKEIVALGERRGVPVMNDLGSGLLVDLSQFGLPYEPTVKEIVADGCDIVTFSGDKLLGGPQAGILVGKKVYIDAMKRNQLTRALRVDKLTLAALESTLKLYLNPETVVEQIPTLGMLAISIEALEKKAEEFILEFNQSSISGTAKIIDGFSQVGGGSYPGEELPTKLVEVIHENFSASQVEKKLRLSPAHIITRVQNNKVLFDMRTVTESEIKIIMREFLRIDREK